MRVSLPVLALASFVVASYTLLPTISQVGAVRHANTSTQANDAASVEAPPAKCDCSGATSDSSDTASLCGDSRLGPANLPATGSLGDLLKNYDPLGGLCPGEFLAKWTSGTHFQYPPSDGFQLSNTGSPIEGSTTLAQGILIDRFGKPTGRFLAPAYTPFGQRALPPKSLGSKTDYHVYRVNTNGLTVLTGTIAAWFGQPGQGTQYTLQQGTTVQSLLDTGVLTEVTQ
ncbi:hypothetical protein B0H16DRAFT_1694247 [Mycena metata]|uniref:TNT domain-containing protein n=1 Tax=Mycena metata TaxID=1033252 RepID=A0AAD7IDI9_9AGAR|nr:hypothetical protein B0H16DRAFT_1694247 [Mycena metata]